MRLIDADELKKSIEEDEELKSNNLAYLLMNLMTCYIDDAQTIDAELVRHGHWEVVNVGTSFYEERKCSCCKQVIKSNYWERCPNCGAKMDEVSE